MIGQKTIPSREGGIEVVAEALAVRMAEKGHDVTLYNCHRGLFDIKAVKKMLRCKNYRGVHIREIPVINIKGISVMMCSLIATIYALFGKYDCIHYHGEGPAVMSVLPHFFHIKSVVTIHGLDWKRSKWGKFASWYLKQGEKIAVACADDIIVLSEAAKRYFEETYHRNTVVIPNSIDKPTKRQAGIITRKWGLEKDDYILYLGRIVPEKRLELLIRAFQQVHTEKKLVIAGAPCDTESFYEKLKIIAATDKRIVFTGFVRGEILDELYSNSYLYCLPSELEGMPISLLEAMGYGNCCLCSDIEECAEVLGRFGYLFKNGDEKDLCKSLQKLCDNPDLVECCRNQVSDFVCDRYSWDDITQQTLHLYKKR